MGKTEKIILTPDQQAWMIKHFKHTKNEECAEKLGISYRSVVRLARRMGLKKTPQFVKKCNNEALLKAHHSNKVNGTYPPKGYRIPNSELGQFKKGEKPIDRLGAKREKKRIAKSVESRKTTYRLEKARALYGLPRQTKLQVVRRPRKQVHLRYYLKTLGYIIERGGTTAYYNENTKRSLTLENKPRTGFTFRQF